MTDIIPMKWYLKMLIIHTHLKKKKIEKVKINASKSFFFNSFWTRGKKSLIRLFLHCLIHDLLSTKKAANSIIHWQHFLKNRNATIHKLIPKRFYYENIRYNMKPENKYGTTEGIKSKKFKIIVLKVFWNMI